MDMKTTMDSFEDIINLYEGELDIPSNENCRGCDAQYKAPLLPWNVGSRFHSKQGGVFLAGKPHRGKPGTVRDSGVIDGRDVGRTLFFNEKWPYWSYSREILTSVYGSAKEGWDHIAFSNAVKCSSTDSNGKTTRQCVTQCLKENQVIFKEIELLRPRKIIFFTWSMHRDLFDNVPFAQPGTVMEHTDKNYRRACGRKQLGWWDRSLLANWGENVDFLILGHPERMKKTEYVEMVSQWITNPNRS